jgi:hypothetical protein
MIWPVEIRMDKYPALGDTVEIEVKFRFIRKDDPTPDAEHLRQFLEDSIFTQHDSLYVTGSFHFSRYRRHDKPSDALKYVSGASLFGAWMTLSDSGSFGARYKAIKVDTVMIGALLRIPYGGGFKHECCVIQENNAFDLGDCWEKH